MGNKIARQREYTDEDLPFPQASVLCKDVDEKKLRLLIRNGELAPCGPGAEEYAPELDECPICFLYHTTLNRSSCCSKSICTECYLQIKSTGYAQHANCPFCKTANYMVEYRGAKTAEEKYFEQAEEQKVIMEKIRIRQKELRDEEERLLKHGEDIPTEARYLASRRGHGLYAYDSDTDDPDQYHDSFELEESQLFGQFGFVEEHGQQEFANHSCREDGAHLDKEQVLLMKAIWLSVKDQHQRNQESAVNPQSFNESSVQEGGLRGRKGRCSALQDSVGMGGQVASGSEKLPGQANLTHGRYQICRAFNTRSSTIEIPRRYSGVHGSLVEDEALASGKRHAQNFCPQMQEGRHEESPGSAAGTAYTIPENYDEQIMLAVALSLADEESRKIVRIS